MIQFAMTGSTVRPTPGHAVGGPFTPRRQHGRPRHSQQTGLSLSIIADTRTHTLARSRTVQLQRPPVVRNTP